MLPLTLTLLVISISVTERQQRCVTTDTDTAGNIYICYRETREVAVLTKDFSREQIFLTVTDDLSLCS